MHTHCYNIRVQFQLNSSEIQLTVIVDFTEMNNWCSAYVRETDKKMSKQKEI